MENLLSDTAIPFSHEILYGEGSQRTYDSGALQVALPIGGIGAGCVCLNASGGLQDFSVRNRPATTAYPDGHAPTDTAFALLHVKGDSPVTRLVEGPFPPGRIYDQGVKTQGYRGSGHEGLPRFAQSTFKGEYPFGEVELTDPAIPLKTKITGFNPFIPLDDKNSGIPCAILEYTFENPSGQRVDFEFSYHLSHLAENSLSGNSTRNAVIEEAGLYLSSVLPPSHPNTGSASLTVIGHKPRIKAMWFRGGWFDAISVIWREATTGTFTTNDGSAAARLTGRNGGSIMLEGSLAPGESVTYPIVITWHMPNCNYSGGHAGTGPYIYDEPPITWRPYYVTQWKNAREVALYVGANYGSLRARTLAFKDALFSSTLPAYVIDAISANLAILKSPTVLRQESGNLWAWEGCFGDAGCCPGSCTHVWNYAQSIPHLFPQLERTFREQEYVRSMNDEGHVSFRSALPDGPSAHDFHAAADGQLGGIMKLHRDWHISGDTDWLKGLYPLAKRSLDYCIHIWDPDRQGAVFEPHHNTYDIEFWGPDGMCTSIYLGALSAMSAMTSALGKADDAAEYAALAAKSAKYMDDNLFNGEYYDQKVMTEGLHSAEAFNRMVNGQDITIGEDVRQLLKQEGPKYQYGSGCLSDGVIGAWMATIYGIESPQTGANVQQTLAAIFRHNFKTDFSQHACTQRPGYAMGHEAGLLLCSWPRGNKPTLPFVYSDEVWTGIEYQVATHLIAEGMVDEGLTIVKAVRDRYEGHVRNPWNEYECGSYYARAMASYALIGALSGFRYSAVSKTLWFGPKSPSDPFKVFFSAASGFGTITLSGGQISIDMIEGYLDIERLVFTMNDQTQELAWKVRAEVGKSVNRVITN